VTPERANAGLQRALLIGTGSIGRRHLANLRALAPGVQVDVLREGRPGPLPEFDATLSTTLDEALAKSPQLVIVATPTSAHLRYLQAAIAAGIAFYAEKPVVGSAAELDALEATCRGHRMPPNIVGCNLRFLPSLHRLRELVRDGALGNIARASFECGQWLPDWRPAQDYRQGYSARAELGGGVALDLIHEIDAARWVLGELRVLCAVSARNSALEISSSDTAAYLLQAERGALASVQVDYVARRATRRYRIVGDQATADWDLPARTLTLSDVAGTRAIDLPADAFDVAGTYVTAMSELLAAIVAGTPTSQPLEEGMRSLRIALQAHTSPTSA